MKKTWEGIRKLVNIKKPTNFSISHLRFTVHGSHVAHSHHISDEAHCLLLASARHRTTITILLYFSFLLLSPFLLCFSHCTRCQCAMPMSDTHLIYPISLTRHGSTRGSGFQTLSQECPALGLNPRPLGYQSDDLTTRPRCLYGINA